MTELSAYEKSAKLHARMRFRYCVRRVLENLFWLQLEDREPTRKDDPLQINLDFDMRVAMHQKPKDRSAEEVQMIITLISKLPDFERFLHLNLEEIARRIEHVALQNRVILRQGHPSESIYAILVGDVDVYLETVLENSVRETAKTQLHPGAMFGEFGVLYKKPRAVTVTASGRVELLKINNETFNVYMHETCMAHYRLVTQAVYGFRHFETYDQRDITEVCFHSRVSEYKKNEIIYSSRYARDLVFFIVEGSCDLVEVLILTRKGNNAGKDEFRQYNPHYANVSITPGHLRSSLLYHSKLLGELKQKMKEIEGKPRRYRAFSKRGWKRRPSSKESLESNASLTSSNVDIDREDSFEDSAMEIRKSQQENYNAERTASVENNDRKSSSSQRRSSAARKTYRFPEDYQSIITYDDTHKCRKLLRKVVQEGIDNIDPFDIGKSFHTVDSAYWEVHLMTIGTFSKSACFNVGENLVHRYIVANSDLTLLEVPKKILAQQKYIIWEQVRRTLNRYVPSSIEVYSNFVKGRMYRAWKQELLEKMLPPELRCKSRNQINNVPYSIRIRDDFQFSDYYKRV